jgi:hypothetical protein
MFKELQCTEVSYIKTGAQHGLTFSARDFMVSFSDSAQTWTGTLIFESSTLLRWMRGHFTIASSAYYKWITSLISQWKGVTWGLTTHKNSDFDVLSVVLKDIRHKAEASQTQYLT